MSLEHYLLVAMHSWAPIALHAYAEDPAITEARYRWFAARRRWYRADDWVRHHALS